MSNSEDVSVQAMDTLIDEMFSLRARAELLEAQASEINKELMRKQADGVEKLKALGRKSYKSASGMLQIVEQWRFNLPQTLEDKEAAFKHFKEKGGKELLYKYATINSNSYNAYCKAEWEEAKARGEGMEFKGPGGSEPKLHEIIKMVKSV